MAHAKTETTMAMFATAMQNKQMSWMGIIQGS